MVILRLNTYIDYQQLRVMSVEVENRRIYFRKSIRKVQLENYFQHKRMLMEGVKGQQAKDVLLRSLEALKSIFINHKENFQSIRTLTELHRIARDYNCIDYFCQFVPFNPDQAKGELVTENLTWLDLLLLILKGQWESVFLVECSAVIANCIRQLHTKFNQEKGANVGEQLKRVMEDYPYQLLKQNSVDLVVNSLEVVYATSLCCSNSVNIYFLLNKATPPLMKLLNQIRNKQELMRWECVRYIYFITCIAIVTLIHRYSFEHIQNDRYLLMCKNMAELVPQEMQKSNSKEEFSRVCCQLTILLRLNLYAPNEDQRNRIQGYLERELAEQNQKYFKLLFQILNSNLHTLTPSNFRRLARYLFDESHMGSSDQLKLRVYILHVLKLHIINCSNRLREDDLQTLIELWQQDAYPLIDLAKTLMEFSKDDVKTLFQITTYFICEVPCPMDFVDGHFHALLQFSSYRMELLAMGYKLYEQEDDGGLYD